MNYFPILVTLLFVWSCGNSSDAPDNDDDKIVPREEEPFFESFEIVELKEQVQNGFLEFLDRKSMKVGLIELVNDVTAIRPQTDMDEVFFIFQGNGTLAVGELEQPLETGDAVIVKGNLDTQLSTSTTITVVVVSMKESGFAGSSFRRFSSGVITSLKDGNSNTWNPFLKESNVLFGLYSLPRSRGGDNTLTHTWEELNIVTEGTSQFTMGSQSISVKPGSIVFVKNGIGHFFNHLEEDIDIMILWEQ